MGDLADGESVEVQGSGSNTYTLSRVATVYQCTCPGWHFQRLPVELRTCKHLGVFRGVANEVTRVGRVQPGGSAPRAGAGPTAPPLTTSGGVPKLLLAHRWDNAVDISGWWMSEKLDGVRAFWDGERLISRLGNVYWAPDWFVERFPSMPMDGELFCGRGAFQRTVSVVRRQDRSDDWKEVCYVVFDAPEVHEVFEERMTTLEDVLAACDSEYIEYHPQERCQGLEHLETSLASAEAEGAEGLMLRQPGSPYQAGRSWTLLKVKNFYDAEGRVVDHQEGTGKHMGRLGALLMELPDGTRFKVGTGFTDAQREDPPAIGSLVTFRYQELTNAGVPRFPSFLGERHDLSWDSLVADTTKAARRASPTAGATLHRQLSVPTLGANPPVIMVTGKTGPSTAIPSRQPPPPDPDLPTTGNIYLEFLKGRSVRYWEVEWDGVVVHIEYGRVDRGQAKTDTQRFPTAAKAAAFVHKQIEAKRDKGYVDEI